VPLARLLAFNDVSDEPLPEKVPPVIVPVSVGEVERTTEPVPVKPVLQTTDVVPDAVQKIGVGQPAEGCRRRPPGFHRRARRCCSMRSCRCLRSVTPTAPVNVVARTVPIDIQRRRR